MGEGKGLGGWGKQKVVLDMDLVGERESGKTCLVQGWVKHVEGWVKQKVVPDMGLGG